MKNIKLNFKIFLLLNTLVLLFFTSCAEKKTEEAHEEDAAAPFHAGQEAWDISASREG